MKKESQFWIVILSLSFCVMIIMALIHSEEGSKKIPYLISNVSDLKQLADSVNAGNTFKNKYFQLTADLDLSSICGKNIDGKDLYWTPIGNNKYAFEGNFDGNGHVISNLYINANNGSIKSMGLFGYNKGKIENLGVNVKFNIAQKYGQAGSLCGYNAGVLSYCYASGDIFCDESIKYYIGGLCGSNHGTINNCYNTANITGHYAYAGGGLCGINNAVIVNCYNTGDLSGKFFIGGICGIDKGNISSCYNTGNIHSDNYAGSIHTIRNDSLYTNCFYDRQTCIIDGICDEEKESFTKRSTLEMTNGTLFNDAENWVEINGMYPRLKGMENTEIAIANALPVFFAKEDLISRVTTQFSVGKDKEVIWSVDSSKILDIDNNSGIVKIVSDEMKVVTLSATCKGTVYKSRQLLVNFDKALTIDSTEDLTDLREKINNGKNFCYKGVTLMAGGKYATFRLTKNLDLSSVRGKNLNGIDAGWTPIGNEKHPFSGFFDGNGHVISNIYIDTQTDKLYGLFGSNTGKIENLGISVNYTVGKLTNTKSIGGMCGRNYGTISHCYTSGSILGCNSKIDYAIGGLCGENKGTVKECFNTACIAGNFTCTGGLCGSNELNIINCYNTGKILNHTNTDGICGINKLNKSSVINCYNIGEINNNQMGLICNSDKSVLPNKCFYDKQIFIEKRLTEKNPNDKGEGKLTAELTNGSFFNDPKIWVETKGMYPRLKGMETTDIASVNALPVFLSEKDTYKNVSSNFKVGTKEGVTWKTYPANILSINNRTGDVQILSDKMEVVTLTASFKGTIYKNIQLFVNYDKVLTVDNIGDLLALRKGINSNKNFTYKGANLLVGGKHAKFRMTRNIDLSSVCGKNINGKDVSWTPIGIKNSRGEITASFCGIFDGGEHVISGLYINKKSNDSVMSKGLFGYNNGIIENLGIIKSCIKGDEYNSICGSICGINRKIIRNCYSYGSVTGNTAGGICGAVKDGIIAKCYNSGNIVGDYVGGICGENDNTDISECHNNGNISGTSEIGGICTIDKNRNMHIYNCHNKGNISGDISSNIGGICSTGESILNCYNNGNITGKEGSCIGGICSIGGSILNCYNSGNITGKKGSCAGGICSTVFFVSYCYNSGNISVEDDLYKDENELTCAGGICGYLDNLENYRLMISNCYNSGNISGDIKIGGICGTVIKGNAIITNCYNSGYLDGIKMIGGICGEAKGCCSISKCYNIGTISGFSSIGNLEGTVEHDNTNFSYCYYNSKYPLEDINRKNIVGKVEGKSTSELQSGSLFNDPENWIEEKGKYPQLKNVGGQK